MKHILLALNLLFALTSRAQTATGSQWAIGQTLTQIQSNMLGSPGYTLEQDSGNKYEIRQLVFLKNTKDQILKFSFVDGLCVIYVAYVYGIHQENTYSKLTHPSQNYWIDETGDKKIYIHREYDGNYTVFYYSSTPDKGE